MTSSLTATWQQGLPASTESVDPALLEAALTALIENARVAHPKLALATDEFLHFAARAVASCDPTRIAALHGSDLFLACAALAADPAALELLEKQYLSLATRAIGGLDRSADFADEVRQALREKLLVGRDGSPALAAYSGMGSLAGWVRIAARRIALNMIEARSSQRGGEDELLALSAQNASPELQLLRERSGAEIKRAVHDALAKLSVRERLMVRLHYLDGVSMTQIAQNFDCHHSSISRALTGARERLIAETRRLLTERLRLPGNELDSLMGLVSSGLDLSLSRALKRAEDR